MPVSSRKGSRAARVVDRLGLGESRPRLDLLTETRRSPCSGRPASGLTATPIRKPVAAVQRVAGQVVPGVEGGGDAHQADGVDVEDPGGGRVVTLARRVAGQGQDGPHAQCPGPEQLRLEPQQVPVAAGEVEDRLDPAALLDDGRQGDGAHAHAGHGRVGDVDRVDRAGQRPGLLEDGRSRSGPLGGSSSTVTTKRRPSRAVRSASSWPCAGPAYSLTSQASLKRLCLTTAARALRASASTAVWETRTTNFTLALAGDDRREAELAHLLLGLLGLGPARWSSGPGR